MGLRVREDARVGDGCSAKVTTAVSVVGNVAEPCRLDGSLRSIFDIALPGTFLLAAGRQICVKRTELPRARIGEPCGDLLLGDATLLGQCPLRLGGWVGIVLIRI